MKFIITESERKLILKQYNILTESVNDDLVSKIKTLQTEIDNIFNSLNGKKVNFYLNRDAANSNDEVLKKEQLTKTLTLNLKTPTFEIDNDDDLTTLIDSLEKGGEDYKQKKYRYCRKGNVRFVGHQTFGYRPLLSTDKFTLGSDGQDDYEMRLTNDYVQQLGEVPHTSDELLNPTIGSVNFYRAPAALMFNTKLKNEFLPVISKLNKIYDLFCEGEVTTELPDVDFDK
jgi:hypothetical protein